MSAAHQLIHSSKTNEWFTPPKYLEAARQVMGGIDLDPASCYEANKNVQANQYIDEFRDGLTFRWKGRVFCNPPYGRTAGRSNQAIWSEYFFKEYMYGFMTEGILLVNAVTDCVWFQRLWRGALCFTDHRIKFIDEHGKEQSQPTHGNVFSYLGRRVERFEEHFTQFGHVVLPR